jgi:membrane associated rhomboid family serine protease
MPNLSLTSILVIITCLISYQAFNDPAEKAKLSHYPYLEKRNREYYRMLSAGFIHGDLFHLLFNMMGLWNFGQVIEFYYIKSFGDIYGRVIYLLLYLSTLILTDYLTYRKYQDDPQYRSLGASGGVSALVFISILLSPWSKMGFIFIPIELYSIVLGGLYLAYTYYQTKNNPFSGGIDHLSHLIGSLYGIAFTVALKPSILIEFGLQLMLGPPS